MDRPNIILLSVALSVRHPEVCVVDDVVMLPRARGRGIARQLTERQGRFMKAPLMHVKATRSYMLDALGVLPR